MPDPDGPSLLQAARAARGWSQSRAVRELRALAGSRAMAVAAAPSLKTLLSRWENGHSVPEPQYRDLLAELYGRSAGELGLILETPPESAAERSLAAALAAASAGGDRVRQLWQQQLVLARELDD